VVTHPEVGRLFVDGTAWADMGAWHAQASQVQRRSPVLRVEAEGFAPFFALTRYADVLAVPRDSESWLNTPWSVLGPEESRQRALATGVLVPRS
jgi:hypothetical protein